MSTYKKFGLLILLSFLTLGVFAQELVRVSNNINEVRVIEEDNNGLLLNVEVGSYVKNDVSINGKTYYSITNDEGNLIYEKGYPDLPKITKSIAIPNNRGVKVSVVSFKLQDYKMEVAPSKGILDRTVNPNNVPYEFAKVYSADEFYPKSYYSLGEPYLLHNQRGITIDFYPFVYNPITHTLRVVSSMVIKVEFEGQDTRNSTSKPKDNNRYFDAIYKEHFINSSALKENRHNYGNEKMLIISKKDFMDEMQPFVEHKKRIGLKTEMVAVEDIGNNSDKIKEFIKSKYEADNQLTFVLLVGDYKQVTTPFAGGGGSDPSYSLISGNDNYPDVMIGRFSAETEQEVTNMVNKTIKYETAKKNKETWFKKGLGIASNDGNGNGDDNEYDWEHLRKIRKELLKWKYTSIAELYDGSHGEEDAPGNPNPQMVAKVVNDGVSIINYTGHGSETSWVTTGFSNSGVKALTNANKLPFIFSVACVNGNFTSYTCFAEVWLRANKNNEPTGAIGFYGSSINQSWQPPMEAQDKFNELFYTEKFTTFGQLCFKGSCSMIDQYKSGGVAMFKTWIYFGDPSVSYVDNGPTAADLLIRDSEDDSGIEPSECSYINSPDINLRDQDTKQPITDITGYSKNNYITNITIKNIGGSASEGNGKERLHLFMSYPTISASSKISSLGYVRLTPTDGLAIDKLAANEQKDVESTLSWDIPKKQIQNYEQRIKNSFESTGFAPRRFDILAVADENGNSIIPSKDEVIRLTTNEKEFAKQSNSVSIGSLGNKALADENFSQVIELLPSTDKSFVISLDKSAAIQDFAETNILLSNDLMANLITEGNDKIKVIDKNRVRILSSDAVLEFRPLTNDQGNYFTGIEVHFFGDSIPAQKNFDLDLNYIEQGSNTVTEHFTAVRNSAVYFKAKANASKAQDGGKDVIALAADDIGVEAKYTWYNSLGNVVGTGIKINIAPISTDTYTLEVERADNGYKSYAKVNVANLAPEGISLSPNPASSSVRVNYKLPENIANATLLISDMTGKVSKTYTIPNAVGEMFIEVTDLSAGIYIVRLASGNKTISSQKLIKQ